PTANTAAANSSDATASWVKPVITWPLVHPPASRAPNSRRNPPQNRNLGDRIRSPPATGQLAPARLTDDPAPADPLAKATAPSPAAAPANRDAIQPPMRMPNTRDRKSVVK